MKRYSFIALLALLAVLIGALHLVAIEFNLYWELPLFDVLLHFLGGVWVALTVFWFLYIYKIVPVRPAHALIFMLVGVLVVGISWEIYEYSFTVTFAANYPLDTGIDLAMDVIGALVAYRFVKTSRYRSMLQ